MSLRDDLFRLFPRLRDLRCDGRAVGGAVRDLLLGRDPLDVDVECSDPLAAARTFGRKIITLGRGELTAHRVVEGDRIYDFLQLSPLGRRDFTINAIAIGLAGGAIDDPFGGAADIGRHLVRMIDAKNFDDDPLRLLRAVRFAVTLGFTIEETTLAAIRMRAATIADVAAERVTYELSLILPRFARAVSVLRETALYDVLFGAAPALLPEELPLPAAYALLLDDPRAFAGRWRWSETLLRDVLTLQRLRRERTRIDLYEAGERLAMALQSIVEEPVELPDFSIRPLLTGDEIAALTGIEPGPRIGEIKRALLEAQLAGRVTTREEAERFVR